MYHNRIPAKISHLLSRKQRKEKNETSSSFLGVRTPRSPVGSNPDKGCKEPLEQRTRALFVWKPRAENVVLSCWLAADSGEIGNYYWCYRREWRWKRAIFRLGFSRFFSVSVCISAVNHNPRNIWQRGKGENIHLHAIKMFALQGFVRRWKTKRKKKWSSLFSIFDRILNSGVKPPVDRSSFCIDVVTPFSPTYGPNAVLRQTMFCLFFPRL